MVRLGPRLRRSFSCARPSCARLASALTADSSVAALTLAAALSIPAAATSALALAFATVFALACASEWWSKRAISAVFLCATNFSQPSDVSFVSSRLAIISE